MHHFIIPVLLASVGFCADNVRFDLVTRNGTALEQLSVTSGGGRVNHAGWLTEEKRKSHLVATFAIPAGEWTEVGIAFTPVSDCEATLNLMGPWKLKAGSDNQELEPIFVTWDKLTTEGVIAVNGDFEAVDGKGQPSGWWKGGKEESGNKVVTEGVKSGNNAVIAWHNGQYVQLLNLAGGKPVRITLWAKSAVDPASK